MCRDCGRRSKTVRRTRPGRGLVAKGSGRQSHRDGLRRSVDLWVPVLLRLCGQPLVRRVAILGRKGTTRKRDPPLLRHGSRCCWNQTISLSSYGRAAKTQCALGTSAPHAGGSARRGGRPATADPHGGQLLDPISVRQTLKTRSAPNALSRARHNFACRSRLDPQPRGAVDRTRRHVQTCQGFGAAKAL